MARSTLTVAVKVLSLVITLELSPDLVFCLLDAQHCLDGLSGVGDCVGDGPLSSSSSPELLSCTSTSVSGWARGVCGTDAAVTVMWTLRAAPPRSAAEGLNRGYTPRETSEISHTLHTSANLIPF